MPEIVLDKRLQTVADLVRPGVVVADIGTDHGHLVCHLVSTRKCPRAFACDIAPGPLARARHNIMRQGLGARIMTMQCDGLAALPADAVGDVVIAGMGGDLIARILLEWEGCKEKEKRFILQPMTKPEHLRRTLYRSGFVIMDEVAVVCCGFVYVVMVVRYSGVLVEPSRFFCHTGTLWEKDPCGDEIVLYMREVHALFRKRAKGYASSRERAAEALEYAALAQVIEEKHGEHPIWKGR